MENPFEIIDKRLRAIEGKLEALIRKLTIWPLNPPLWKVGNLIFPQ